MSLSACVGPWGFEIMLLPFAAKLGAGLLAVAGVGTVAVAVTNDAGAPNPEAIVTRHVDGDTFEVIIDGHDERIRLLNIDTPETKDPDKPVQCLGPEASKFLSRLLPIGSPVRLEYDKQRRDRYGRLLAAVFTSEDQMVNAEVARAGFAKVVTYNGNDKFRPPIEAAWREAAYARRGLHSTRMSCTLPAQLTAMEESASQTLSTLTPPPSADSDEFARAASRAHSTRAAATSFLKKLAHVRGELAWTALTPQEHEGLTRRATAVRTRAAQKEKALRNAAKVARTREQQAQIAAQQRAAARAARQAAAQAARQAAAQENDSTDDSSSVGGGDLSGYTGPRCYAPGGETWRPC